MAHSPTQRLRQLQRVLLLISLLSPLRFGATVGELARDIADEMDDFCPRTIHRDLLALETLRLVEQSPSTTSARADAIKWKWTNNLRHGRALQQTAEALPELRKAK